MASATTIVPVIQHLMTVSVDKIVASRCRRGGVSLHRNLLVAGVLFRTRDALLEAQKTGSVSSTFTPSESTTSEDESLQKSSSTTLKSSKVNEHLSEDSGIRSTPRNETVQQEKGDTHDDMPMDVSPSDGKENVPLSTPVQSKLTDIASAANSSVHKISRKRSHSVSVSTSTADPVKTATTAELETLSCRKRSNSSKFIKVLTSYASSSSSASLPSSTLVVVR